MRFADFTAWNGKEESLRRSGVRIFGPNASAAQDLEPEFIAVSADGRRAWATLQENNALAIIDVVGARVEQVVALGYRDHNVAGHGFDAQPFRDQRVNIRPWPVLGMYQLCAIAAYTAQGATYLVTANEGDPRDYTAYKEEVPVGTQLDPGDLHQRALRRQLCRRCQPRTPHGDQGDGDERGDRAVADALRLRHALLQHLERRRSSAVGFGRGAGATNERAPDGAVQRWQHGGTRSTIGATTRDRSPKGSSSAGWGSKTFAFIGLERVGGIMVYDVTRPTAPQFVTYANTRDGAAGDLGPGGHHLRPGGPIA